MVGQVHREPVEPVGDGRASGAAGGVVGTEHEVVDQHLRAPAEQITERSAAVGGVEAILLLDRDPGQLHPAAGHLVALMRQLLLGLEQLEARSPPLFAGSSGMAGLLLGSCGHLYLHAESGARSWELEAEAFSSQLLAPSSLPLYSGGLENTLPYG